MLVGSGCYFGGKCTHPAPGTVGEGEEEDRVGQGRGEEVFWPLGF